MEIIQNQEQPVSEDPVGDREHFYHPEQNVENANLTTSVATNMEGNNWFDFLAYANSNIYTCPVMWGFPPQ